MAFTNYLVTIRSRADGTFMVLREDQLNGQLFEAESGKTLTEALDLLRVMVLANPAPIKITAAVSSGA